MALSTAVQSLSGKAGYIYQMELGAEQTGDGITALTNGYYLITAVGGTTGWPTVSGATGAVAVEAGYPIKVDGSVSITPETGDKYKELTLTALCDVSSWGVTWTADELEDTTYCNVNKTYAVGKTDFQGNLEGIVKLNRTDLPGGFLQNFTDIAQQDGATSYDLFKQATSPLVVYLVSNNEAANGDELAYFAEVNVFGGGLGGAQSDLQTFSSSFRLSSSEEVKPVLFRSSRN